MDCSMPRFPVHHQIPELAQTHVHRVGDAIQPSHRLSSPSPPAVNLPIIRVFSSEPVLRIRWPKYWSFSISPSNKYSGLISFRIDWFDLLAVQGPLFFFFLICLSYFIFGCSRSLSLCMGFLYCGVQSYWSGFSCCRAQSLGVRASVAVAQGLSCPAAYEIFPDQGSNQCPMYCKVNS